MHRHAVLAALFLHLAVTGTYCHLDNSVPNEDDDRDQRRVSIEERIPQNATFEELYDFAVRSYLDEDWDACLQGFHALIDKYRNYKEIITDCRKKCRISADGSPLIFRENIEDLHFYEKKVYETLCLLKCHQEHQGVAGNKSMKRISRQLERKLANHAHYEYLHICYYQKNHYQKAANALFTYMIKHPDHEISKKNLLFYIKLPGVSENNIRDMESEPFVYDYISGIKAYEGEYYEQAIKYFENSLATFIEMEDRCRFYCEGPFDHGLPYDFVVSTANHFAYTLQCKMGCARILSTFNNEYREDFLASHYNYLQFAYYKLGKLQDACEAVASYLFFSPGDEIMLNNKKYYSALPKVELEYFTPRKEALDYIKRQQYEIRLMNFINEEFNELQSPPPSANEKTASDENELDKVEVFKSEKMPLLTVKTFPIDENKERKIRLIAAGQKLGGENRFLAEGVLSEAECQSIVHLSKIAAVTGDGYEDNISPHSIFEQFEGVTISRVAVLVYFGYLEPQFLNLLLRVTDIAKRETEKFFDVDHQLYFTYTHLACRSALPGSPPNRQDLSHAIHADNCLARDDDGPCAREAPAYIWRDFSTIVYLNDDFDGGEFIFTDDTQAEIIQSSIRPKCGKMLTFSSGPKNLHGVKAVTKGRRCALGLWFTFQRKHREIERELAIEISRKAIKSGFTRKENKTLSELEKFETILLKDFLKNSMRL